MTTDKSAIEKAENDFPGYPIYPPSDDIFNKSHEEDVNLGFNEGVSKSHLDVPGANLDDEQENIGSEDEENNYYSIGGDNHDNLEEDKPEVD